MIVVDIEATGTDPEKHSIASIGAVDFSRPEATFYEECRIWDGAHIEEKAFEINGITEAELRDQSKMSEADLVRAFFAWVVKREERTVAGQNPHFDIMFVQWAAKRAHENFILAHREIDLHSIVYFHMVRRGLTPPVMNAHSGLNSDMIMEYVGIPAEPKPHIALNGAVWEAEALSRLLHERSLLPQFGKYPIPWLKTP